MATTTLTSKGQLTLPKEIRDRLGLKEGDRLRVIAEEGRIILTRSHIRLENLTGILPAPARPITVEEMNEAIAASAIQRS